MNRWKDKNGVTFTAKEDMDIESFKEAVDGVDEWFIEELKSQGYEDAEELVEAFTGIGDYSDLGWAKLIRQVWERQQADPSSCLVD